MKKLVISFIYLYRWLISPFIPPSCKFIPTCSRYAISAIECHGLMKGIWMTIKRLSKCHPLNSAPPLDPVHNKDIPAAPTSKNINQTANSPTYKRVHHA